MLKASLEVSPFLEVSTFLEVSLFLRNLASPHFPSPSISQSLAFESHRCQ